MTPAQAYILITERPFQYAHLAPRHEGNIAARIQKAVRDEGHRPALPKPPNGGKPVGVSWDATRRRWLAQINIDGKNHYLGVFAKYEQAVAARKAAEKQMENHK